MRSFYTCILLIEIAFMLTHAYNGRERYDQNTSYAINVKGQLLCNGGPFKNAEIMCSWYTSPDARNDFSKSYSDENGFFNYSCGYSIAIRDAKNPFLLIKNSCGQGNSFVWNWFSFDDWMVQDVARRENVHVELNNLELSNLIYSPNHKIDCKCSRTVVTGESITVNG